jgi:hypothetical protein
MQEYPGNIQILKIGLYLYISGIFLSVIFGYWWEGPGYFSIGYPVWSHLLSNDGSFDDFYGDRFESLGDYCIYLFCEQYAVTNPPIASLIGKFFYFIPTESALVIFILINTFGSVLIINHFVKTNHEISVVFFLTSFPLFFAIFRGNNDLYLVSFLLLIMFLFLKKSFLFSSVLLGILSGLEPLMILFIIVFFRHNKKLTFVISTLSTSILVWISPLFFGERNIQSYFTLLKNAQNVYSDAMIVGNGGQLFNESIFGFIKFVFQKFFTSPTSDPIEVNNLMISSGIIRLYLIMAIIFFAISIYFIFKETNIIFNFLNMCVLLIILPYVSASYKLLLLTVALIFIINYFDLRNSRERFIFFMILIILIPKHYTWLKLEFDPVGITLQSLINPMLMIILLLYNFYISGQKVFLVNKH